MLWRIINLYPLLHHIKTLGFAHNVWNIFKKSLKTAQSKIKQVFNIYVVYKTQLKNLKQNEKLILKWKRAISLENYVLQ